MVNLGRSGRCNTCRERRVKCDETKPHCRRCIDIGRNCGGYRKSPRKLKIKDESHKFIKRSPPPKKTVLRGDKIKRRRGSLELELLCPIPRRYIAVSFFLTYNVSMGRGLESTRGFFELIVPVLEAEPQDSPLSTAVSGVADRFLSLWTDGPRAFLLPEASLNRSLNCLRAAIEHPTERRKPSTILAALLLHLYENVASVYRVQKVLHHHFRGAKSLLSFSDARPVEKDAVLRDYISRFLLHHEVSLALREGRRLPEQAISLLSSRYLNVLPNPSSALDELGANIAEFRFRYKDILVRSDFMPSSPSTQTRIRQFYEEGRLIEADILAWAQQVPSHWRPIRLRRGQDFDSSVVAYKEVCEIYPSCQIASIWNLWRCYYLLLTRMFLEMRLKDTSLERENSFDEARYQQISRSLTDTLCYSVAFFLGNRSGVSKLQDFADRGISLPSYRSIPSGDARRSSIGCRSIMSAHEHKQHVVAQGAWHIMGPLSYLLTMLSDEYGWVMTRNLAAGQHDWVRQQFLRVVTLLRLNLDDVPGYEGTASLLSFDDGLKADYIARRLRGGLTLIGGI